MRAIQYIAILLLLGAIVTGPVASAKAQTPSTRGYKIDLQIFPFQNQWVYLAYYYGSIKGLADSAFLDANSRGAFIGKEPLPPGIYIVASPTKTILFEMLVDETQHFAVSTDTLDLEGKLQFKGSAENDLFHQYTQYITPLARKAEELRRQLNELPEDDPARATLQQSINAQYAAINDFRLRVIEEQPESLLAVLFKGMQDVNLPENLRQPRTRDDSLAQFRYIKDHYWDNFDFMDGRLVRTPIFDARLKTYFANWVAPIPDSIIYEQNWMMALGRNDPEMSRYLISYFVDNYINPKIMGHDKVFLHTWQRYIADNNPASAWLNEKQRKTIDERAYMIMANQLGAQAYDMEMVDTAGNLRRLYDLKNDFVVVSFWDPQCGKCKEELPRIDSLYKASWKKHNVQVYAVMVNEESIADWKTFIRTTGRDWVHVHQTREMRATEEKAGKPSYRQLYDMRSTPTLFLLDKEKRIVAKNIGLDDLHRVLEQKIADVR